MEALEKASVPTPNSKEEEALVQTKIFKCRHRKLFAEKVGGQRGAKEELYGLKNQRRQMLKMATI